MEKRTKRERGSNWNHAQTIALAKLRREASHNKDYGPVVWERIAHTLSSRFPDQIRTGAQCRRRWDTLVKVYNHIEDYCIVTGAQDHRELDEGELASMKLDTAYHQKWYDIVEQVCSQRKWKERCDRDLRLAKRFKESSPGSHAVELPERPSHRDTFCSASTSKSVAQHEQSTPNSPKSTSAYAPISSSPSLKANKPSPEEEVSRHEYENDGLMLEATQLQQHGQVSHQFFQEPQTLESAEYGAQLMAWLNEPLQDDLWDLVDVMPFETSTEIEQSETELELTKWPLYWNVESAQLKEPLQDNEQDCLYGSANASSAGKVCFSGDEFNSGWALNDGALDGLSFSRNYMAGEFSRHGCMPRDRPYSKMSPDVSKIKKKMCPARCPMNGFRGSPLSTPEPQRVGQGPPVSGRESPEGGREPQAFRAPRVGGESSDSGGESSDSERASSGGGREPRAFSARRGGRGLPMAGWGPPRDEQGSSMPERGPPRGGRGSPMLGRGPPRGGRGLPMPGREPPRGGRGSPMAGRGPPRGGRGWSMAGRGPPRGGRGSPMPGRGPPRGGRGSPMPGWGPPRGGRGSPMPGRGPTRGGQGLPMPGRGSPGGGQGPSVHALVPFMVPPENDWGQRGASVGMYVDGRQCGQQEKVRLRNARSGDSTISKKSRRWSLQVILLNVLQCCHARGPKESIEDMEMVSKQAFRFREKTPKKALLSRQKNVPAMFNAASSTSATSATKGGKPLQKDTRRTSKQAALDKKGEETRSCEAERQQLGGKSSSKCLPVGKLCAKLSKKLFLTFHGQCSH